ncbi:aminotransferase class III-fold pyridoxal phosphate-dependent enzyme [Streptomyces sp. NPDC056480]|uniref:aminotransferase class III-fold pyridoxal phosphate-dependent enzyme n=1 Tax=Streptomyces sp. NPDC056480 TaxID=3345833 RepID=UPI0036A05608
MVINEASAVAERIRRQYQARTQGSRLMHEEAKRWLPGGDTRTINHFTPYPTFMSHGSGCTLTDVDGNDYLDFINNMGSMVHGHSHPTLTAAASDQLSRGTALGTPVDLQLRHARIMCERVPSVALVRYTNSGTEATMLALRAARAFTGKNAIVKIDGGYHGVHNDVTLNMFAGMPEPARPQAQVPETFPMVQAPRGVPPSTADEVFLVRYNDLGQAAQVLASHSDRIAAVIVEPMMGAAGCIPADVHYLHGLRDLTRHFGVLMILDECSTFRLGPLQERYGLEPDLTTVCKIIGGGIPLGVLGGSREVMSQFDPSLPQPLYHAGAFVGNGLALRVGIAALEMFGPAEVARLNGLGERLIRELPEAAREAGISMQVTGIGSQAHWHWGNIPLRNARDVQAAQRDLAELPELVHLELLNSGIHLSRRGLFTLSTPMTDRHIDSFRDAMLRALRTLRPYIAERIPRLLTSTVRPAVARTPDSTRGEESMSQLHELASDHYAAINAGDIDAVMAHYAPDVETTTPNGQLNGAEAVRGFQEAFHTAAPDARIEALRTYEDGGTVLIEGMYSGTHTGPLNSPDGTIPATDRPFKFTFVEILECSGGRISNQRLYWDNVVFLTQLGLLPG